MKNLDTILIPENAIIEAHILMSQNDTSDPVPTE